MDIEEIEVGIINMIFDDDREIINSTDSPFSSEDKLYFTEDNELILIKVFSKNHFTGEDLAEYTSEVEELYFYFQRRINLYIVTLPYTEVDVVECTIKSEADFTIKLAKSSLSFHFDDMIEEIKQKIKDNNITEKDISMLESIPVMCNKNMRKHYRKIVFNLLTEIDEKKLIRISE